MTASKASQITIRKIATPAANAPGNGIMSALYSLGGPVKTRAWPSAHSGFEASIDGNFSFEQLGDGASGFGGFHGGVKFGFVGAGNFGDEIKVALGDAETVTNFVERDGGGGL